MKRERLTMPMLAYALLVGGPLLALLGVSGWYAVSQWHLEPWRVLSMLFLTAILMYMGFVVMLSKPLRDLAWHIRASHQDQAAPFRPREVLCVREVSQIWRAFEQYRQSLAQLQAEQAEQHQAVVRLLTTDPLTETFSRHAFEQDLRELAEWPAPLGFVLFDCDHFKSINDTYGHQVGDEVIIRVAGCASMMLGAADRLYRLGGDEFAAFLPGADEAQVRQRAESLIQAVAHLDFADVGVREPVRISIGYTVFDPQDAVAREAFYRQADLAMYEAKHRGRGRAVGFSPAMVPQSGAVISSSATACVFDALAGADVVEMHYQPVVNLGSGATDYYEALVRLRSPDGLLTPNLIFPVVEAKGITVEFDYTVLAQIERDLRAGALPVGSGVSINLAAPTILHPDLLARILPLQSFLQDLKIVLELTETVFIDRMQDACVQLDALRAAGFTVALDDFGQGYSSIRHLAHLPVDVVKFDISLTRSLVAGDKSGRIIEEMAGIVARAGYRLVAEGVEEVETLAVLNRLGFSHAQGYYFGKPARIILPPVPHERPTPRDHG